MQKINSVITMIIHLKFEFELKTKYIYINNKIKKY